jgi:predicted membrane protein
MFIFEASFAILAVLAFFAIVFFPLFLIVGIVVGVIYLTVALTEASIHYLRFKRWRLLPYRELFPGVYAGTWRGR